MSECERFELEAAAYAEGSLDPEAVRRMRDHARTCPDCRRKLAEVDELLAGTASVREDIHSVMGSVDWDALPDAVAARAFAAADRRAGGARLRRFRTAFPASLFRPVLAAAAAGLVLGAAGMFLILKPGGGPAGFRAEAAASKESIDAVELGLAKQETLDYLDRSQTILLEYAQNGSGGVKALSRAGIGAAARDLVAKKRYLNSHLDSVPLAKARAVCDQIEALFIELSRIGDSLTPAEAAQIRDYIERKQLLLKIKLVRSELSESEV